MKKAAAVLACVVTMAAASAHAEHKLLITDVLDAKQAEFQAGYEYARLLGTHAEESISFASVGAGLGHGLEISAAIPYSIKGDEFGNLSLGAKYRLLDEKPLTMVVGFDISIDVNGDQGVTAYRPYIAVSKDLGHELKPYAAYIATIMEHEEDYHTLRIGVEKELPHGVTLDAKLDANFVTGPYAYQFYTGEVGTYLELFHNFYLIPSVGYQYITDTSHHSAIMTSGSLYYLF